MATLYQGREDAHWLAEERQRAWEIFQETPLPPQRSEEWKYTDLSRIPLQELSGAGQAGGSVPLAVERTRINGWSRRGVILTDLLTASTEFRDTVQGHLHSLIPPSRWKLSALHSALLNGGSFLYVPGGVEVDIPLRSQYLTAGSASLSFPHTLIVLGPGASATYTDEYLGDAPAAGLSVAHVEIILAEDARLTYFNLQQVGPRVAQFVSQAAVLGARSRLTTVSTALGGDVVRGDVRVTLSGGGAQSDILGIILGDGRQSFDFQTLQDHTAPETLSDLLFKAALKDRARSNYTGLIRIEKKAQKSNAFQANRNLLMNRGARAFSTPKLEIEADDVRCTHGVAVGTFEDDQLFYLMSRGIGEREAQRLIVEGFFDPVISRIPEETVRERVWATLGAKLASLEGAGGEP